MSRVAPNNPVRRQLIFEDSNDERIQNGRAEQITTRRTSSSNPSRRRPILEENVKELARTDNSVNILQESLIRDREEKSMKWNFDFAKEEALPGQYEWYKKEDDEWVIMEPRINNKCMRYINENTPFHVRDETAPQVKKRKNNIDSKDCASLAKRKIDFD